jgi:hypothetical protein
MIQQLIIITLLSLCIVFVNSSSSLHLFHPRSIDSVCVPGSECSCVVTGDCCCKNNIIGTTIPNNRCYSSTTHTCTPAIEDPTKNCLCPVGNECYQKNCFDPSKYSVTTDLKNPSKQCFCRTIDGCCGGCYNPTDAKCTLDQGDGQRYLCSPSQESCNGICFSPPSKQCLVDVCDPGVQCLCSAGSKCCNGQCQPIANTCNCSC